MDIKDKIKKSLDEYIGFDSNEIFFDTITKDFTNEPNGYSFTLPNKPLVRIFGGAIRDIIADKQIHDIDILVGALSYKRLSQVLLSNGYKYFESLTPKDLSSIYSDIKVINEPHTYIKGDKIIQLIRPVNYRSQDYEKSFINLIQNVDISCCGLSYDGNKLYENFPDSLIHCLNCVFISNKYSKMYSEKRHLHRIYKLEERGWNRIDSISDKRDIRINTILENGVKIEYEKEHDFSYLKQ